MPGSRVLCSPDPGMDVPVYNGNPNNTAGNNEYNITRYNGNTWGMKIPGTVQQQYI